MADAKENRNGKPGRKGCTYEQYKETYESIVAEGKILSPSNDVMRTRLGGCSEERLCSFKRRYQEEKSAEMMEEFKLPSDLALAVARAIFDRSAMANENLAAELASNRKDMDSLLARITDLQEDNSDIEKQRLEMQLANSRLEGIAQQLRVENEQLSESLKAAQLKILQLTSEVSAEKVRDEVHGGLYRLIQKGEMHQIS